jgi:hypothetical protein
LSFSVVHSPNSVNIQVNHSSFQEISTARSNRNRLLSGTRTSHWLARQFRSMPSICLIFPRVFVMPRHINALTRQ